MLHGHTQLQVDSLQMDHELIVRVLPGIHFMAGLLIAVYNVRAEVLHPVLQLNHLLLIYTQLDIFHVIVLLIMDGMAVHVKRVQIMVRRQLILLLQIVPHLQVQNRVHALLDTLELYVKDVIQTMYGMEVRVHRVYKVGHLRVIPP